MNGAERPPGFEVPVHRSLTEPILLAGIPRTLAVLLWSATAAFVLALHQLWMLPIGIVLHLGSVAAAKRDPYFFDVFLRALKAQRRLLP